MQGMYTPIPNHGGESTNPRVEQTPDLRKPSQTYVNNYMQRRLDQTSSPGTSSASAPRGRVQRIFYQLEEACPVHYYPKLKEVDPRTMLLLRRILLVMCLLQLIFSLSILYLTYVLRFHHDSLNELFTYVFSSLCAFAAFIGLVGTCFNSRAMLLFFYINQL